MSGNIPYIKWKSRVDEITPEDHRVGTDVLLIDDTRLVSDLTFESEPFKVDMTMTLIYEQGTADLKINMKEYHIQAPAILIVMSDQIYQSLGHSDDVKGKVILMSRAFSDGLFLNAGEMMQLQSAVMRDPVFSMENEQGVFDQFYNLLYNVISSPMQDFKMEAVKHLTLSMFYGYSSHRHELEEKSPATTRQEEIYQLFMDLLSRNYKEEREISFYADKLCITPKYLSTVVKDLTGKTALDMIEDYVISECKALLLSTAMTVQQISDQMNFSSQSVFGKYFKRLTGMSPKEYRKNVGRPSSI